MHAEIKGHIIEGIDLKKALLYSGTIEIYLEILEEYYKSIEKKSRDIERNFQEENWKNYTVDVHGLKSISRQIGAMELGDFAADLELASKAGNIAKIKEQTPELLREYQNYKMILAPLFETTQEDDRNDK